MIDNAKIIAIGTYIPEKRVSNFEKAVKFGDKEDFVRKKIGFENLSIKGNNETVIDMCQKAFLDLRKKVTEYNFNKIDLVLVVTQNPMVRIPHNSAIIHSILGLDKNCMTFDISQGCAGYTHALEITSSLMKSGKVRNGLIFTCDPYSSIVNNEDRNVSMIFGDAATVTLIRKDFKEGYELVDSVFGTLPEEYDCLILEDGYLKMDGKRVFNNAAGEIPTSIERILSNNKLKKDDINKYILHPGSKFIIDSLTKIIKLDKSKVDFSCVNYGNTVSSSIPLMLSNYTTENIYKNIIISGFGVGFSWGTGLLKYVRN